MTRAEVISRCPCDVCKVRCTRRGVSKLLRKGLFFLLPDKRLVSKCTLCVDTVALKIFRFTWSQRRRQLATSGGVSLRIWGVMTCTIRTVPMHNLNFSGGHEGGKSHLTRQFPWPPPLLVPPLQWSRIFSSVLIIHCSPFYATKLTLGRFLGGTWRNGDVTAIYSDSLRILIWKLLLHERA